MSILATASRRRVALLLALAAAVLVAAAPRTSLRTVGRPGAERLRLSTDHGPSAAFPVLKEPRLALGSRLDSGKLLVAARSLRDPNFSETVILLLDYTDSGAVGVVINDLLEVRVAEVFPEIESLAEMPDQARYGGPVAMNQAIVLLRSEDALESGNRIFDDVWVAGGEAALRQAIQREDESFRVYLGYAGWAPGQLDAEVARDDWHIFPADAALIFDRPPAEIWPELIRRSQALLVRLPEAGTGAPSSVS